MGSQVRGKELKSEQNMSRSPIISTDEGNQCSICQDTEMFTDMYALPCAHKFHELCINEWLKKKSVCPICRLHLGNTSDNASDEGLGERYGREESSDVLGPPMMNDVPRIEFFLSGEEEDDESLVEEYSEESEGSTDEELEVHIQSNFFSGSIEPYSNESNTESEGNESDNNESDAEQETSELDDEPDIIVLDDESDTSELDYRPETSELEEEQATSESEEEQATSESEEEQDTSESEEEQATSESEEEQATSESEEEQVTSESEEEQDSSESEEEQDTSESDTESDYESDTE